MDALRAGGTYVNVAGWEKPVNCIWSLVCQNRADIFSPQFIVLMEHFMMKALTLKVTMSYTSKNFREVVEDFIAGQCDTPYPSISMMLMFIRQVQGGEAIYHEPDTA
jgi:threonine dehydrogenase-like Zn-dependent dehydrogenase